MNFLNKKKYVIYLFHDYFLQLIEYKAQGSTKEENTNLQTLNLDGVAKGKSYTCSESLTIPPMDYPNIGNCPIIRFYYILRVQFCITLFAQLSINHYKKKILKTKYIAEKKADLISREIVVLNIFIR